MEQLLYHGWTIEPETRTLAGGGYSGKVRLRRGESAAAAGLVWLSGRWDTEEEARRRAIEAGMRLIDAGLQRRLEAIGKPSEEPEQCPLGRPAAGGARSARETPD
jgi:hypothetical protein